VDVYGAIEIAMSINGLTTIPDLQAIASRARGRHNACEVGCFCGRVTKLLSLLCTGTIYAVDRFDSINRVTGEDWFNPADFGVAGPGYREVFDAALAEEIATGKVRVYAQESHLGADMLRAEGVRLDFAFIDASHDLVSVTRDIQSFLPLMNPGSVIGGHDYYGVGIEVEGHDHEVAIPVDEAFGDRVVLDGGTCWFVEIQ
jgi:hypothetical protein